jgi:hypothetical protein
MKNRLQYIYSISVFMGVIFTAYFIMSNEANSRVPLRSLQGPVYRAEAVVDPAVQQLLQMEQELARLRKEKFEEQQKRVPTEVKRR